MEDKAIRGVPWTIASYAGNKLVFLATTVVLARLLVPEDFGLLALALLAVTFFNVFSDLGLSAALVLRQDLSERAKGTVLTLMLALSAIMATLLAALSPLIAGLFNEPRLAGVLAALAPMVFLAGITWFYEAVLQRELEFRRRFAALAAQSVTYAVVTIVLAALDAGVWSLVAGQIVATLVLGAVLVTLAPYRVRPAFDRADAHDILESSKGFMVQGGLAFISRSLDYFAVGRVLGATQVGFYSMAFRMAELPYLGIADPVAKVTFPGFARMHGRGEDVGPSFLSTLRLIALVTCPLGVWLSATAEPFTQAVFDDRWLPMIGPVAVLGIWAAIRPLQATIGWLLNSIGEASLLGWISALGIAPLVPALLVAADLGGITAVAWVVLAEASLSLVVLAFFAQRRAGVGMAQQLRVTAPVLAGSAVSWVVARAAVEAMGGQTATIALAVSAVAGLASYVVVLAVVAPGLMRDALAQIGRTLGRDRTGASDSS